MRLSRLLLPAFVLLAACSGPASDSLAQSPLPQPTRVTPTDGAMMRLSFAPVVHKAAPAVVNVYSQRVVRQQIDPLFSMLYGELPRARVEQSLGSGVIVRSDGVIVTNNHVVEGGQEFMVVLNDRREFPARVLLADKRTDLAVLKIDPGPKPLPTIAIADSRGLQVGDLVLAIGDPFGVGQTVTNGIISALNRTAEGGGSYIQTDAPINRGNSGGALVDMNGDLIGINSFILTPSGGSAGIGFAIPGSLVRRVVETALHGGHALVRPWIGASMEQITPQIARSMGLNRPVGAYVTQIYPDSPAAKAGLKVGDVVETVGGGEVEDPAGVEFQVSTHNPGDVVPVVVLQNGQRRTLNLRVEAPPEVPAPDRRVIQGRNPLSGAAVVNLSPAENDALGVDIFARGVAVADPGQSPAGSAGLQAGDRVLKVDGHPVQTTRQLQELLSAAGSSGTLTVEHGGQAQTLQYSY